MNPSGINRVVIVVFDGLRADMVTKDLTPNILRVAQRGTWFREARTVFPSVTRVATASIATGAYPSVHGVVGNAFHFAEALPNEILDTGNADHIRTVHAATKGRFISADTMGDVLARNGLLMTVAHAGSAGSTYCINPRAADHGHWTFSVYGEASTQTPDAIRSVTDKLGPLPRFELPKLAAQNYLADAMTDVILAKEAAVSLVWFSEPDTSFHYLEIGSEGAQKALKNADAALGRILDQMESTPLFERTAIVIASDHGQISTSATTPLFDQARSAGFPVASKNALEGATITGAGGSSGELRVHGDDRQTVTRLAHWLMEHDSVSHVFSRGVTETMGEIAGTLALECIGQGHARTADLMFVLKSDLSLDKYGLSGMGLLMPGDVKPGGGYHGGLNPIELNSVLIVAGGNVPQGATSAVPAGVIDIAPTVLDFLGLKPAATMQGRSLLEAADRDVELETVETGRGAFSQRVNFSKVGQTRYIRDGGQL